MISPKSNLLPICFRLLLTLPSEIGAVRAAVQQTRVYMKKKRKEEQERGFRNANGKNIDFEPACWQILANPSEWSSCRFFFHECWTRTDAIQIYAIVYQAPDVGLAVWHFAPESSSLLILLILLIFLLIVC